MSINYGCEFCELHYSYSGKYCGQFHNNIFSLKEKHFANWEVTLEVLLACCMHYNLKVPLQDSPEKTVLYIVQCLKSFFVNVLTKKVFGST